MNTLIIIFWIWTISGLFCTAIILPALGLSEFEDKIKNKYKKAFFYSLVLIAVGPALWIVGLIVALIALLCVIIFEPIGRFFNSIGNSIKVWFTT